MFDFINDAGDAVFERFFLQLLDGFDREDLDDAIRNDVSLLDETAKYNPKALAVAEGAAKRFRSQIQLLTTMNVLGWLKEKRYELYFAFISDQKSRVWLERQISEFRTYLWD